MEFALSYETVSLSPACAHERSRLVLAGLLSHLLWTQDSSVTTLHVLELDWLGVRPYSSMSFPY